jgi:hypothetical protein
MSHTPGAWFTGPTLQISSKSRDRSGTFADDQNRARMPIKMELMKLP